MITQTDFELFTRLVEMANKNSDGHLTMMKFTTNWRISLMTPDDRDAIAEMTSGKTFAEAARRVLGDG